MASAVVLDVVAALVVVEHSGKKELTFVHEEQHAQAQACPALEVAPEQPQAKACVAMRMAKSTGQLLQNGVHGCLLRRRQPAEGAIKGSSRNIRVSRA